jgi:iron complex outermembrane receptor protein
MGRRAIARKLRNGDPGSDNPPVKTPLLLLSAALAAPVAAQQAAPTVPSAPTTAPTTTPRAPASPAAPAAASPPAAAASAPAAAQRVEITGGRVSDTDARRRATAAKIIIGREEIEQYGDSSVGEVLRRLPGVTTPGTPGRGGPPRMRGLGSGDTQLLIDGQPIPRGFSLESLTPDQVERIEILRSPTAETGARAIAGTINIVLREGFRQRLNDVNVGIGYEDGELTPGVFWAHNDSAGDLTYNLNAGTFLRRNRNESLVLTDVTGGADPSSSSESRESFDRRRGLNLGARLQWRLGTQGDSLVISPGLFRSDNQGESRGELSQQGGTPLYDLALARNEGSFTNLRLNGQWRQRLGPGRLEATANANSWRAENTSRREESIAGVSERVLDERGDTRENALTLGGKYTLTWGGDEKRPGSEHSFVTGGEIERTQRSERRSLLQNGQPLLTDFGENLGAESTRVALYAQNEWTPAPQWATHLGLRWEGIRTVGDQGDLDGGGRPANLNSVFTPLAHAVWKPDPASRSQVRVSLTRSWRAPALNNLIARPSPNTRYPVEGPNAPNFPDRAGNPDLKPELATGIDLAWEHYPAGGGVLSASLFRRQIRDLMRSVTTLETVSWSPVPRWVARTRNIGDATTQGLELEAKGRLDQWLAGSPRVEVRSNLSVFHSRVEGVPGPDNRLDQQPGASANLGADYRWPGLPLKTGANINWVPAYETQTSADQRVGVSTRRVFDVFSLWTFSPGVALRLSAGNALPRDSDDFTRFVNGDETETTRTLTPSNVNWQLRLELKL